MPLRDVVHGSHGCIVVHIKRFQHLLSDSHSSAVHTDVVQRWPKGAAHARLSAIHWRRLNVARIN